MRPSAAGTANLKVNKKYDLICEFNQDQLRGIL